MSESTRRKGFVAVLRDYSQFRLLFSARVISMLGDWFSFIAVIALLREVTGSDSQVLGGYLIIKLLPFFFAGPLAGVLADRFDRKRIMIVSDLVRVALVGGLFLAPFVESPVPYVFGLSLLQVVAAVFFEPARGSLLPELVKGDDLTTANALGALAWSVVFTLGSALGGVVTELFGWRLALILDMGTYLLSAFLLTKLVLSERKVRKHDVVDWKTWSGYRDFRDGMVFILRRPRIATVISIKTGWGLAGGVTLLLTLFGERIYDFSGRPDLGVTFLYVARALGTGIGPLLARRFVHDESPKALRVLVGASFVWASLWYLGFSWTDHAVVAFLCVLIAHFGGSVLWVYSTVLLQRLVPDDFRGRVLSTDLGLATLSISASVFVYGELAASATADLHALARWMGLSVLAPALFWIWASGRYLKDVREES